MQKPKVFPLLRDSYLAVIDNSVGSSLFRNLYAEVDGEKKDIMDNGDLSCAFFTSSILALFKLVKETHATVDGTVRDLQESGWKIIKEPKIGAVLVWEKADFTNDGLHKHVGFYVENEKAISNSSKEKSPTKHHWTFNGERKVEMIFWNEKLEV